MSNLVPFGFSFHSNNLPAPSEENPLPTGQSQLVTIICTQESLEFLLETFNRWFEDWDHVILRGHGLTEKEEDAFIALEWEGCFIDAFFLQLLRKEEPVIDFCTFIRDSEV